MKIEPKKKKKESFYRIVFQGRVRGNIYEKQSLLQIENGFEKILHFLFLLCFGKVPAGPLVKFICMAHCLKSQRSVLSDATLSHSVNSELEMTENMIWKASDTLVFLESLLG